MFDPNQIDLPIVEILPELETTVQNHNTLIVHAPPGAGKSTLLPLTLLDQVTGKIIMLEPRRLAARSIAGRLAELIGEDVGNSVGYRIRFESRVSANTRIEVVTEGILTRMLQSDNELKGVGLVIFDEFHERSIHADVALALCRESQQVLRPDIKILIMSATLNTDQLANLLQAPVIKSEGRQFPVDVKLEGDVDQSLLPDLVARTIIKATKEAEGDLLVFLPGQREITRTQELVRKKLPGFAVMSLYGQLPYTQQRAALLPDKQGRRKVVLSTNIAETSLTIEGVSIVVDSGFERTLKWDPKSSLSRLETVGISKDSADQRAAAQAG